MEGGIFRAVVRRNTFLDPLSVVDDDRPMHERIEQTYAEIVAGGRPQPGPSRDELIEVMTTATVPGHS